MTAIAINRLSLTSVSCRKIVVGCTIANGVATTRLLDETMEIYEAAISDFNALLRQWERDSKQRHLDDRRRCAGAMSRVKLVEKTVCELYFRCTAMNRYMLYITDIRYRFEILASW